MIIKFIKDLFIKNTEFETILDTPAGIKACKKAAELMLEAADKDDQLLLVRLRKIYDLDDKAFVEAIKKL